eukprot:TRINITY_DN4412_c0_g1_i1.p1 TRINITY_DN4412_c0_g1~~TRINITY_DN4412_c0_g1_i1.p1  ORF type:complete len:209 (+),score=35.32 TRINITY_DN4412_c0_g1_i1:52-627(+)
MLNYITSLFILLLSSQVFADCPNPSTATVDPIQYQGVWYEIATTPLSRDFIEKDCYCTFANYSIIDTQDISVVNHCNLGSVTGQKDVIQGRARIPDLTQPGKLEVTFGGPYAPYWIINLDPDYQWAVIYSCESILGVKVEFAWVLARNNTIDDTLYNKLLSLLKSETGYDVNYVTKTAQQGCDYRNRKINY